MVAASGSSSTTRSADSWRVTRAPRALVHTQAGATRPNSVSATAGTNSSVASNSRAIRMSAAPALVTATARRA